MDSLAAVSGADPLAKIQHLKSSAAGALAAVEGVEQKGRRARGGNGSANMFRCTQKVINKCKNEYTQAEYKLHLSMFFNLRSKLKHIMFGFHIPSRATCGSQLPLKA